MYTFRLSNKTQTGIWGCSRQLDRLKRQFQLGHVRWLFISSVTSSNMAAHTWQSTEFSSQFSKASLSIKTGQCLAIPEPPALCVPAGHPAAIREIRSRHPTKRDNTPPYLVTGHAHNKQHRPLESKCSQHFPSKQTQSHAEQMQRTRPADNLQLFSF